MKDDRYPRTRYSDVLGEDPGPERVRLVEDIQALYSPQRPPPSVASSVRMAIREEAEKLRTQETADATRVWLRPVRRSLGVAGFAGFALVVAAVAVGLAAMLSRMGPASSADTAATGNGGNASAVAGSASTETAAQLSPLLSGSGVLHIKGINSLLTAKGEAAYKWTIEFWYDRATGDARFEARNVLGRPGDDAILLYEGQTFGIYEQISGYVRTFDQDGPSAISRPVEQMFNSRVLLRKGRLVPAVGVAAPEGQMVAVEPGAGNRKYMAYLDKATGLTHRVDPGSGAMSTVITYSTIETLDRASLPRDLFDIHALPPAPTEEPALLMPSGTQIVPGPTVVPDQPATAVPNQPTVAPAH
jgi:hypothetical protein